MTMKIGKYYLHIIHSGMFALDGGAMFGIIPKPLWEKTNPPDKENKIPLATRLLLLVSDSKKILIDTGMGTKWEAKAKEIYNINQDVYSLDSSLNSLGIKREDVTDVILTHLHFDHTGGSTIIDNGKLIPAFHNAVYYVQKKNFEWGMNATERDKGSYLKDSFLPLLEQGVLKLIGNSVESSLIEKFDDDIDLIICNGHTFAQQLPLIHDSANAMFFSADLFPTSSHLHLPYIMAYDLQPLVTLSEKKIILKRALEENWKIFFEHDPYNALSNITLTEKGYRAVNLSNEL